MNPRRGARRARQVVDCDLELRPLMNVFIVLIPMLLMSAVFIEIRVIEMSQPRTAAASTAQPAKPLELALRIAGGRYVLAGNGVEPVALTRTRADAAGTLDRDTSARLAQALARIVAEHPENHEIRIVAEGATRYQELVSLMDLARSAGLPEAALVGVMEGA
jgi:biopolymer transport protein ExbD